MKHEPRLSVVHVLQSYGIGGGERVAFDLAKAQRAAGCDVRVISLSELPDGPLASEFAQAGIEPERVPKRHGFDPTLPPRLAWRLRHSGRARPDVVHTHNPQPLIYGALAGRLVGAAVVHTKHGANVDIGRRVALRRAAAQLVHAFIAVSEDTARVTRDAGEAPASRLEVIANGIDLSRFNPDAKARAEVRRELGLPEAAWVIGTVGRLAPAKDQALLARAAGPLLREDVRLVVVGDGPSASAVRAAVASLPNPAWATMTGARSDVPRVLTAFDVFAMSSQTEGLPLSIPEAMATAMPVVSTAVGGIPMVIDEGETGYLVPSGDEAALRSALAKLEDDRQGARRMGARAREVSLARYSAERMVRAYFDVYARVRR